MYNVDHSQLHKNEAGSEDECAVCNKGYCALSMAVQCAATAPTELPEVAERVEAVIERCAQAQLGTSYAAHVASLTVGARVTWTNKLNDASEAGDFAGTIVRHDADDESRPFEVEGAISGQLCRFPPSQLRLA